MISRGRSLYGVKMFLSLQDHEIRVTDNHAESAQVVKEFCSTLNESLGESEYELPVQKMYMKAAYQAMIAQTVDKL